MANITGKERAISRTPGAFRTGGLGSFDAAATVAVKDLKRARDFYEGKLRLTIIATEGDEVVVYQTGKSVLMVYVSQFAGTNKATGVTWVVGDHLEELVQSLNDQGVSFEHYDLPGTTREGDIHSAGNTRVAWFKDPDGNIVSLVNG
jgi:catechol 2,3-dioxygenase-like lactoylglutathione lyase family enzyme